METRRPKILIADDEPANRIIARTYLTELAIEIIEAMDGRETLALIEKEQPQLVLLDIRMPYLSGFEVLEELNKNRSIEQISVLVVTAYSDIDFLKRAFDLGAVDFVLKPFKKIELLARVKSQISQILIRQQQIQTQQLQTALAVGGAVAHEMNQPLCALTMLLDIYSERYGFNDTIEKISLQTERLTQLVRKFSQIKQIVLKNYTDTTMIMDINQSSPEKPQSPNWTPLMVSSQSSSKVLIIHNKTELTHLITYFLGIKRFPYLLFDDFQRALRAINDNSSISVIMIDLDNITIEMSDFIHQSIKIRSALRFIFLVSDNIDPALFDRLTPLGQTILKPFDLNQLFIKLLNLLYE